MPIIVHHQKAVNPSKYRILVNKLAHSKHDQSNEISNKKRKSVGSEGHDQLQN
jgi:methylmalonyl-CoA mutase cobalamin-binding subunit